MPCEYKINCYGAEEILLKQKKLDKHSKNRKNYRITDFYKIVQTINWLYIK